MTRIGHLVSINPAALRIVKGTKTQQTNRRATTSEKVYRAKNPRIVKGDGKHVGESSRLDSGSIGELGQLEPMVNLVLDFLLSLYLCVEAGSDEGVLKDFVRGDNGRKNGGEKVCSPGFWT